MKWIKLESEDQLPEGKTFLLYYPSKDINDKDWGFHYELFRCTGRWVDKETGEIERNFASDQCSVNDFDNDIKSDYTHFIIIEKPT